jgi:hypothetical protein
MNKTEKGTAYEQFVLGLYQSLHDADGFENVTVEHNKSVTGRSGCAHQIDVYWAFTLAGKTYRTAVECKAFDQSVPIGKVRDFYGVLADVSGLQGIFVSLFGFQSGAQQYADHYGIDLKEVRPPVGNDWDGRVKDVHIRYFVITPEITEISPAVTQAYIETLQPHESVEAHFSGTTYDAFVVDDKGQAVATVEQIRQQLPVGREPATDLVATVPFPGCYYNSSNGQRIPIDGVTVRYAVSVEVQRAEILGAQVAHAIMKDVKSGNTIFFDRDGGVRPLRRT